MTNISHLITRINEFTQYKICTAKCNDANLIQIFCSADHKAALYFLSAMGDDADFIWHQPRSERTRKYVIKGLNNVTTVDDIRFEVTDMGIKVTYLHPMTRKTRLYRYSIHQDTLTPLQPLSRVHLRF